VLEYAVDKAALIQVYGGPLIAQPMHQAVVSSADGYIPGYDPYPTPGDHGDSAKARALLTEAGYPNGVPVKLLYRTYGMEPQAAQTVQASLQKAGFSVQLVPSTGSDFFAKYLQVPDNAKRGVWDLAVSAWIPDWFGNNGRTVIEVPFDGRTFGPNTTDYGDYNNDAVNALMDKAIHSLSEAAADTSWALAAKHIIEDATLVPLIQQKIPIYHAARLQNCIYWMPSLNCDITQVWIQGAHQ
jgi:peptide/nickel transport system substrate-binding protein